MFDKTQSRITLALGIIITLSVQPQPVFSLMVWSDDFDDGDLNGWDLKTYCASNPDTIPWELCNTLISNTNYQLHLEHVAVNVGGVMSVATHNSTTAYGQWSFDVISEAGSVVTFFFLYNNPNLDMVGYSYMGPIWFDAYGVRIYTSYSGNYSESGVMLMHFVEGFDFGPSNTILDLSLEGYNFTNRVGVLGEYHIDVTRQLDGNMTVYVDSEKVMSTKNTDITNSTQLAIQSQTYAASIDNIIVYDEITIPKPPTTPTSSSTPPSSTPTSSGSDSPIAIWYVIPAMLVLMRMSYKRHQKL